MLSHLAFFTGLLIVAYLFAQIANNAGLPAVAATTLVGIAASGMFADAASIALTPATLALFLPALIFDGAWAIDGALLRRHARTIAILAGPGTLATATIVAGAGACVGLPILASATLGAILAATDPVAVLAVFHTMRIPSELRTIVEGESIANDGVAAVLTSTLVAFAISAGAYAPSVPRAVLQASYATIVGLAIGAVCAFVVARIVRRTRVAWITIAITLVVAYGSYALATFADASGIFASAAAGVVLRGTAFAREERERVAGAWDAIANVANAVVFLLVGLNLRFERIFHEPALICATIAGVVLARIVLAYVLAPIGARAVVAASWKRTLAFSGLRGGLSLALALGLPHAFPSRAVVLDATFAVVFVTVVLQGWAIGPVLRRIDFRAKTV